MFCLLRKGNIRFSALTGYLPRKVNPHKRDLARIQEDARLAKAARMLDAPRTDFEDGFIWPVTGKITGVYGSQRILNGEPRPATFWCRHCGGHWNSSQSPRGWSDHPWPTLICFFSGATVILDHGHGLSSTFLHLNKILVKKGDRIAQGDVHC